MIRLLRRTFALLLLALAGAAAFAQDVLPVPPLSGRVVDQTRTLTDTQRSAIASKLEGIERQHVLRERGCARQREQQQRERAAQQADQGVALTSMRAC